MYIPLTLWKQDGKVVQGKRMNCWQSVVLDSIVVCSKDDFNTVVCAKDNYMGVVCSTYKFGTLVYSKDILKYDFQCKYYFS